MPTTDRRSTRILRGESNTDRGVSMPDVSSINVPEQAGTEAVVALAEHGLAVGVADRHMIRLLTEKRRW